MVRVKVKKLDPGAKVPSYAYEGDAGLDLYSNEDHILKPKERRSFKTGISLTLPKGYVALVWDKSGISHRQGIKSLGGVIDAGFRGECKVGLVNLGEKDFVVKKGDKIAQLLIQKVERAKIEEVKNLEKSIRGERGFGSSGR